MRALHSFIDPAPDRDPTTTRAPDSRRIMHIDSQLGTRVDDFTVAYRIARGMNADVFAVWHHTLRTPLVCKRLRPEDADDHKWRRLLLAEGATLARLSHPGIVRLVAQERHAALPYLLLEHVGSRTLRDELRESGGLPVAFAVRVTQHVAAAISYMHTRGYLHRDIKPSNVVMRGDRPVLLDFGVAWRLHPARRPPDRSGTPQRLAPEQIARDPLTPATDVYGLATLVYELLTSSRPFPASEHAHDHRAAPELRYPQLTHAPRTLRDSRADAPAELERIITRALARDPANRFPTAHDFAYALDPFTDTKIYPAHATTPDAAFGNHE